MRRPLTAVFGILVLVYMIPVVPVSGGGVVSACTEASLRAALIGGGNVTFSSDCSINITHQIPINQADTTIDAGTFKVSISSSNGVPLFVVTTNLTLHGLSLVNGTSPSSGGAMFINPGVVVVANGCVFGNNSAVGSNGLAGLNGTTNSVSTGGDGGSGTPGTPALGGAIYNQGTLTLVNCAFTNNNATGGAGGSGGSGGDGGGTFAVGGNGGNGAGGGLGLGGAIYNLGDLTLINCTFSANTSIGGSAGAGGAAGTGKTFGMPGNGSAGGNASGGAVFNARNLTILSSTFSTNSARGGASSTAGMQGNGTGKGGIKGGQAVGGAVYSGGLAAVTNSTFYTNLVFGGAGGNGGYGGGTFQVPGDGGDGGDGLGGAFDNANTVTLVNCTFSSNGAFGGTNGVAGSGKYSADPGNPGGGFGGNVANAAGSLMLQNSILTAGFPGGNVFGLLTDAGYNLSSDAVGSLGNRSFQNVDPLLGPLAHYGGPTLTMALLTNSPAIDKIPPDLSPSTDQRNFPRPINLLSDIGAVEFGGAVTATNITLTIGQPTNGLVQVSGAGIPGLAYLIQASTNLSNWQVISTNVSPILFLDPVTNLSLRYYRVTR